MVIDIDEQELSRLIFEAVGFASMCWDNVEGAGVFESHEAVRCGEELMEALRAHERQPATLHAIPTKD